MFKKDSNGIFQNQDKNALEQRNVVRFILAKMNQLEKRIEKLELNKPSHI